MGTSTSPAIIAAAPQLIGDWMIAGKYLPNSILAIISSEPNRKLTQHAAFVVFF